MPRYTHLLLVISMIVVISACATMPRVSSLKSGAPPAVTTGTPKTAKQIQQMNTEEWRTYMRDRMDSTTTALLTQLSYNSAAASNPTYNNATQAAHEKKFGWTIVGITSSTLAGVAAGASKWIIGGLGLAGAIATAVVSHYGDQEAACVTAGQAIDDVLVFRSKWTEVIMTAMGPTDTTVTGYDTAEDSLVKEVRNAQYQCPANNDP